MNGATAESGGLPGELPVTVISYGPAVTYAIKKLPLTLQLISVQLTTQVALAPTGAPETVQAMSDGEKLIPVKRTGESTPLVVVEGDPAPPHGTCTVVGGGPTS